MPSKITEVCWCPWWRRLFRPSSHCEIVGETLWERMWNPEDIEPTWVPLPSGLTLQSEYDKPVRKEPTMTPNTEEARRLASELRSVIPPKNHEASRILDSAAFTLRLLAADVNKLKAENEAMTLVIKATTEALKGNYN